MKPLNIKESGCVPTSSNCIIWNGPTIPCINLCKGDTITTVVYALATELCNLLDSLNINTYDITCFGVGHCGPQDFTALIQLLIDRICALENGTPTEDTGTTNPNDSIFKVVTIAPAFYYTNHLDDTVTTMTIYDYVLAIGNKVSLIVGQITTINSTLSNHASRIKALEDAPPPTFDLPQVTSVCVLPGLQDIDLVLEALEKAFCDLRTSTGDSTAILKGIQAACDLSTAPKLYGTGNMSSIPNWNTVPTSLAQSFSNLWKTVCDMRSALVTLIANTPSGASAIKLVMAGTVIGSNTLSVSFTGSMLDTVIDNPPGSALTIVDSVGNSYTVNNVLIKTSYFNNTPLIVTLLTNIVTSGILKLTTNASFKNSITNDPYIIPTMATVLGTSSCPTITVAPGHVTVDWSFTWNAGAAILVVDLLDGGGNVEQSVTYTTPTVSMIGSFINLQWGSSYSIRLSVNGTPCSEFDFTTDDYACVVPLIEAPTKTYTDLIGATKGNTIVAWQLEYDSYHP